MPRMINWWNGGPTTKFGGKLLSLLLMVQSLGKVFVILFSQVSHIFTNLGTVYLAAD